MSSFKGPHVRGNDRQAETVRKKQNATLVDISVRQHEDIGSLEIHFGLIVRNELRPDDYSSTPHFVVDRFARCSPVFLTSVRPACDNQTDNVLDGQLFGETPQSGIRRPFVGRNSAKKKNRSFIIADSQPSPGISGRETRLRDSVVDPERDDCDPSALHAELLDEFELHLFCMNEDVVSEVILDSQRKPIEERIRGISPTHIHVVRGKYDLLSQQLVVKHQQGSVKVFEFVVPQDMKDLRPGGSGVPDQPGIIRRNSGDLFLQNPYPSPGCRVKLRKFTPGLPWNSGHSSSSLPIRSKSAPLDMSDVARPNTYGLSLPGR